MSNRQQRRAEQRAKKKQGIDQERVEVEFIQPWSDVLMRTRLSDEVLNGMLDITEHHSSEDRGDSETVMNAVETYDSLHSILTYVGDVYNTGTRFYDEPRTGKYIP